MIVMSDTCFCEYTDHGHCGVLHGHEVDNDRTLLNLGKQAVAAARAGADVIAPSAAMDGQVQAIRKALDEAGFSQTAIMAYSTKFARSEEHTSELQSLMRISYAVFCLKKKKLTIM